MQCIVHVFHLPSTNFKHARHWNICSMHIKAIWQVSLMYMWHEPCGKKCSKQGHRIDHADGERRGDLLTLVNSSVTNKGLLTTLLHTEKYCTFCVLWSFRHTKITLCVLAYLGHKVSVRYGNHLSWSMVRKHFVYSFNFFSGLSALVGCWSSVFMRRII